MLTKIISGGQTGADRAALDAAIELDIPYGARIMTAAADADQKEIYTLAKQNGRWLVDDLVVTDEEVKIEDLEI
jgi:hypothetical protein